MSVTLKIGRITSQRGWKSALLVVALIKGFVAGAGLGIAALGLTELTHALLNEVGIVQAWAWLQREQILEAFAIGGGMVSIATQIIKILWSLFAR